MVRKRYTEEQIIQVLREGEAGAKVADLCRKYGMSEATYLQLEGQVCRHDGERCEAAEGVGGGEPALEADSGGAGPGQ